MIASGASATSIPSISFLSTIFASVSDDPFAQLDHVHLACACGVPGCTATLVVAHHPDSSNVQICPDGIQYHVGIYLDRAGLLALQTELTYHLRALP